MSADSKTIGAETGKVYSQCKIIAFGDKFVFQIAGLIDNKIPNGWDARLIAKNIWKSESLHESDAATLVQRVSDKWIEETKIIYSDPEYIKHKRKFQPESPVIANVVFAATDKNGQLSARAVNVVFDIRAFDSTGKVALGYPFEDEVPGKWITAGSSEIIREYMDRSTPRARAFMDKWDVANAKLSSGARQAALAREMIDLSIRLHPNRIKLGRPIEVVQIEPTKGIRWIANENRCQ